MPSINIWNGMEMCINFDTCTIPTRRIYIYSDNASEMRTHTQVTHPTFHALIRQSTVLLDGLSTKRINTWKCMKVESLLL